MARLTINKAGFHLYGARVGLSDQAFEYGPSVADAIFRGEHQDLLQVAGADVDLHLFMHGHDFVIDELREDYAQKTAFLQGRLMQEGESPDDMERRLRIEAIDICLRAMRPTDVLKLTRHHHRRDLNYSPILGHSPPEEARREIASWRPQVGPDHFVPADYYMK